MEPSALPRPLALAADQAQANGSGYEPGLR